MLSNILTGLSFVNGLNTCSPSAGVLYDKLCMSSNYTATGKQSDTQLVTATAIHTCCRGLAGPYNQSSSSGCSSTSSLSAEQAGCAGDKGFGKAMLESAGEAAA